MVDELQTLTTIEAAAKLRVSTKTLRRMLVAGALRGVRVGKAWRVPATALDEYLRGGQALGHTSGQ